jgi:hypothetical protein
MEEARTQAGVSSSALRRERRQDRGDLHENGAEVDAVWRNLALIYIAARTDKQMWKSAFPCPCGSVEGSASVRLDSEGASARHCVMDDLL